MSPTAHVLIILFCLVGTGLFAGLETGVISIHRLRLRHMVRRKMPGARILQDFLEHPDHLLGTTLVGTNLCMVTASITSASLASRFLGAWGAAVSSLVMTLVILVACEYLPKAWFQSFPAMRTRPFAKFLRISGLALYPISRVIVGLTKILVPAPTPLERRKEPWITKDELKHLTRESEQSGELTASERRMIHGVFELTQKKCGDIMTPQGKMIIVQDQSKGKEILKLAYTHGYSRFPVREKDSDRFVGIVHTFDILHDPDPAGKTARDYMRSPQFVPGVMPVDDLLPRLRATRQPIALVNAPDGKVIGLVTLEDVLEEIVGEL